MNCRVINHIQRPLKDKGRYETECPLIKEYQIIKLFKSKSTKAPTSFDVFTMNSQI